MTQVPEVVSSEGEPSQTDDVLAWLSGVGSQPDGWPCAVLESVA